jgi:hypothetical protein
MSQVEGMNREPLEGPDLVLLLLAAPTRVAAARNRVNGILRLEKLVFLSLEEEEPVPSLFRDSYAYDAYHLGPYSKDVYEAVDLLEEAGLVQEEKEIGSDALDEVEEVESGAAEESGVERRFWLTPDGERVAQLLGREYPELMQALTGIKDRYAGMPSRRLVRYVYDKYPVYTGRSKIKDLL